MPYRVCNRGDAIHLIAKPGSICSCAVITAEAIGLAQDDGEGLSNPIYPPLRFASLHGT